MERKGYPEPSYTQTPNLLFDEHMRDMSEVELKVVLCAVRKTLGWHKQLDPISLTQFQHMTGLSRKGVLLGIERAIERGVLQAVGNGLRGAVIYQLCLFPATGEQNTPVINDQAKSYTSTGKEFTPELVYKVDTQKKGNKEKKKDSAPASQDAGVTTASQSIASKARSNPLFDALAEQFFMAKPDDKPAVKAVAGRVGKLVSFLITRNAVTPEMVKHFVAWYRQKHSGLSLPNNPASLMPHWQAFEAMSPAPASSNGSGKRKAYYHQHAWVEASRLSSDGTLDGTTRPGWMLAEITVTGEFGGVALHAGEKVYHDGTLPLAWQGLD